MGRRAPPTGGRRSGFATLGIGRRSSDVGRRGVGGLLIQPGQGEEVALRELLFQPAGVLPDEKVPVFIEQTDSIRDVVPTVEIGEDQ